MIAIGRLRTGLRWLLLAQLAVGLLVQPVLGLASELHVHIHPTIAAHGPAVVAPAPERLALTAGSTGGSAAGCCCAFQSLIHAWKRAYLSANRDGVAEVNG